MRLYYSHHESLDSTNSWAKKNQALLPQDSLSIITTDHQTQGRGRYGRKWLAIPGNLYLSFAFYWPLENVSAFSFSQIATLSLQELVQLDGKIKWPNDLLINNKKIAGILTETTAIENLSFVVVGIGLNVNASKDELTEIQRPATSLFVETGIHFDLKELQEKLVQSFSSKLMKAKEEGFYSFTERWIALVAWMKGQYIKIQTTQTTYEGQIEEILPHGDLLLNSAGTIIPISGGEIF